jgi:uncharacterized protein involved in exopolysaccharide biosynthesis
MSRIDDALRRVTGVAAELRQAAGLEMFAREAPQRQEPGKPEAPKLLRQEAANKVPSLAAVPTQTPDARMPAPPAERSATETLPAHADVGAETASDAQEESLVDFRQVADYLRFVGHSFKRHKLLALSTCALVIAMTVAAAKLLPKTYYVQTKLLAQRNAVMAALSNPGRSVPWDADAPTRSAAETVLRRDNLIALMRQTDLMNEWERTRAPILKVKDWVTALVTRHKPTLEEKQEGVLGLLEARMFVVAGPVGDGTVTIELYWPSAEMAYQLVQHAQQAFLDARQQAETAAIGESIGILERYSSSLHDDINRTLSELQRTQSQSAAVRAMARTPGPLRTRLPVAAAIPLLPQSLGSPELDAAIEPDPEIARLKAAVTAKRQELARIEETRQRQLSEVQARLAQLTAVYTSNHPSVLSAQQNLAALSAPPPQAAALRADIDELQLEYNRRTADAADLLIKAESARRAGATDREAEPARHRAEAAAPPAAEGTTKQDMTEFSTLRLRSELNQLESVLERTDGARIELAVSQAAFKYRYSIIRPAQVPRDPIKPDMRTVVAAGIIGSLLLALIAVVGRDLLSDRILEPWQIERQLGLRVLGSPRTA